MNTETKLAALREAVSRNLTENILPFWSERFQDETNGGFLGRISGEGFVDPTAPKGAILNARILWAFSAAYRVLGRHEYLQTATRAFREIADRFYDSEFGGVYWSLDAQGRPLDTKKQIYAIGFAIYGLSEYARATASSEAKELAIKLFHDIEQHSFDTVNNGYLEALTCEWEPIADMRLSEKDANERKTMNTHLHIIEPYTALYRVWPDEGLKERIRNLLYIFREKIMDKRTGHLQLFFDDYWNSKQDMVSYGHDIEASWLLHEAASVIGEDIDELLPDIVKIAAAASEGYVPGAGMMYEMHRGSGAIDADRHWWVQAETVVGYLNIYQLTGDEDALNRACETWEFIRTHLVDSDGGDWFWSLKADGSVNTVDDKAGFWKCPYHNSRMCLEIIERIVMMKK
jgi:cellobiose epimerase